MSSYQKIVIVGNLGRDPELKEFGDDKAVCTLNVATSRQWKNKDGEKQEETEWHRVKVWGPQAKTCAKFLTKGRSVLVEGRLKTSSYDKDGQKHYSTDVVAEDVRFLGGKGNGTKEPGDDWGEPPPSGDGGGGSDF